MTGAAPDRAYRGCGVTGLVAAAAVAELLAAHLGLNLVVEGAIIAAAVLTFLALAWVTTVISGRETLVYYHHEIAVLAVSAAVAALAGAPVLAHLDVTALGLGTFLAFGRLGCLQAGCCHGRPWRHGVRYDDVHVRAGFPAYLRGVALFPVQLLESAAVAAIVAIGTFVLLDPAGPGRAFAFYVTAYAVVRLALEEMRGDVARRYLAGLSIPQWTSLGLLGAGATAGRLGLVPGAEARLALLVAIAEIAIVAALRRRRAGLLTPRHVRELARTATALRHATGPGEAPIVRTAGRVRVSAGQTAGRLHVSVSGDGVRLRAGQARRVAEVIAGGDARGRPQVIPGGGPPAGSTSTFHVVFDP